MKTFTITEEQVKEAYNAACNEWKTKIKDWFPEAFEKKLEVGKVYKWNKALIKVCEPDGDKVKSYGFNKIGEWYDDRKISSHYGYMDDNFKEATEEEWLEALKEEAKRRGFIEGIKFNCPYSEKVETLGNTLDYEFTGHDSEKFGKCLRDNMGYVIFYNGIWSEIVKEEIPTQEEIDRVLDYLKNKNNS